MEKENKSVWSQEKEVREDISEAIEENASEIEESIKETADEIQEAAEAVEENVSEMEEVVEETVSEVKEEVISEVQNMKKNDQAVALVGKAKNIVKESEKQLEACKLLLSDDLKEYEEAKKALNEGGLNACEALLSESGYIDESEETIEEDGVVFEAKEDLAPIVLQDVSSGKFTGFIMALIGGAVTLGGMIYVATEKLGVTLDLSKVPAAEAIKPVFGYYGTLVGMNENANIGMALVAVVTLLVMWIIYAIRVSTKGSKNLHFATQQLEEAEAYTAHKSNCKEEMDKVDVHIHNAISTLKTYQVLFNEQKGKLQRILHIEGTKEALSEYHEKSILEMRETQGLINSVRSFMATPMSEEGKLSGKSTLFLHSAKSKMQKVIDRLY
ncbi:hypothetical protein ACLHDG_10530 [Sulfurovum sp. CS9]|uniref:hypothetical protein n=1 Tax=Sulfurovum sp. CS9 TaxID=3391146 RepID=UPI0039EB3226